MVFPPYNVDKARSLPSAMRRFTVHVSAAQVEEEHLWVGGRLNALQVLDISISCDS